MRPISFIRTRVFQQTQASFAKLAGVTQGTVSKWEAGTLAPSQEEMSRIRTAAIEPQPCAPHDGRIVFTIMVFTIDEAMRAKFAPFGLSGV
ncbi:helix-turn-helix domain-containing protein [Agrobacterium tumefaciens]|uniref:helix-turn-helix domain-containing protein n=1 Tax=Agrobacterium tumefaciens TaxID=358 RepID=UPI003A522DF8